MKLSVLGWMCVIGVVCMTMTMTVRADVPSTPDPLRDVDLIQNLGGRVPLDAAFIDDTGRHVTMKDYFTDRRPVVLVMAYYECPMLCTLVLNSLAEGLHDVPLEAGKDFDVVVISINPRETPALAAQKKRNYVTLYGRLDTAAGWHLLTGREPDIRAVADAIGFKYVYDEVSRQYAHPAGVVMLTPDGVVSRYFYGASFRSSDLKLGLLDSGQGTIGSPVQQVLLRCYQYDPMTGRYGFAVMQALRITAVATMAGLVALVWWMSHRARRRAEADAKPQAAGGALSYSGFQGVAVLGSIWDFPLFPPRASTIALRVDVLYAGLCVLSTLIAALVCALVVWFAVKYRAGSKANRTNPIVKASRMEVAWIGMLVVIGLGLFIWADMLYFTEHSPPPDTLDIYVVAKQWMWKMQHPGGQREIDELHVPQNRPVKLIMTSQDVVHSMFIPAFRVKQDVLPSGYSSLWFVATTPGEYHLFCSQYCGADHARMVGKVVVMTEQDYQKWLTTWTNKDAEASGSWGAGGSVDSGGGGSETMASAGAARYAALGCANCHVAGSSARAPDLTGLFGRKVLLRDGATVVGDAAYIRESILDPQAKITAGYPPVMPTYKGQVDAQQLAELVEYIKSLGSHPAANILSERAP